MSGVGPGKLSVCQAQDFGLGHASPSSGTSLNILLLHTQPCRDLVLCPYSVILRPENLGKASGDRGGARFIASEDVAFPPEPLVLVGRLTGPALEISLGHKLLGPRGWRELPGI